MMHLDLSPPRSLGCIETGEFLSNACINLESLVTDHKTIFVLNQLQDDLGLSKTDALAKASYEIASAIDDKILVNDVVYHNAQHTCEVMIGMAELIRLNDEAYPNSLDASDKSLLLLGAVIHDLTHDGMGNMGQPFKLENAAFDAARPFLVENGVSQQEQDFLHGMVLVTDVTAAPKPMMAVRQILDTNTVDTAKIHSKWPENLGYLWTEPYVRSFALFAGMLSDADLMPSSGWGVKHHLRQSEKLCAETKGAIQSGLGPSTVAFINTVLNGRFSTKAGGHFQQNIEILQQKAQQTALSGAKQQPGPIKI